MNTEKVTNELESQLASFNLNDAYVRELAVEAREVSVSAWDDTAGYKICKERRVVMRKTIDVIETKKKELKGAIEQRAKELRAPLEEAEQYLTQQLRIREDELARQKREAEEKRRAALEELHQKAQSVQMNMPLYILETYLDRPELFEEEHKKAKVIHEQAELTRLENEEKLRNFEEQSAARVAELERREREVRNAEREAAKKLEAEALAIKAEKAEREAKERAETEKARTMAAEDALMAEVQEFFPTLPLAWAEIVRLRNLQVVSFEDDQIEF